MIQVHRTVVHYVQDDSLAKRLYRRWTYKFFLRESITFYDVLVRMTLLGKLQFVFFL